MEFSELFSRLDHDDLAEIVGPGAVRLLSRVLDESYSTTSSLRELTMDIAPPESLLLDRKSRASLLEFLPDDDAIELARLLGGSPGEHWETLKRPLRSGSAREAVLFNFFGLELPERERQTETTAPISPSDGAYTLFPHQRRAVKEVNEVLAGNDRRVMLHMPTGSGKTRTALNVCTDVLRREEPGMVIWLAFSEELCEQAASEFEEAWSHLGNRRVDTYRLWGSRSVDLADVEDGFLVLGLAKALALADRNIHFLSTLADRSSLVVFDEAHQAVAPKYRFVLEALTQRANQFPLVGLSATPGRTWNDPEKDAELAALFAKQKVTLSVDGEESPVDYLIENGFLARPEFVELPVAGPSISESVESQLAESLDITPEVLQHLADDEIRNLAIMDAVESLVRNHRRVLLFAATVDHAYLLATVLRARGHDAEAISSRTNSAERRRMISDFRDSSDEQAKILCNFGVLTTGFDAPRTSAAVIARPTKSLVLYGQMMGRAIRGEKQGGNRNATIVTVVDTALPGFGQPSEAFTNWEDVW